MHPKLEEMKNELTSMGYTVTDHVIRDHGETFFYEKEATSVWWKPSVGGFVGVYTGSSARGRLSFYLRHDDLTFHSELKPNSVREFLWWARTKSGDVDRVQRVGESK